MKAVVKAAFFDREASLTRQVGEVFEASAARIDAINAVLPGTVEKVAEKRAQRKKADKET